MLSRMSCNAKNSLATPVQLNPVTILKVNSVFFGQQNFCLCAIHTKRFKVRVCRFFLFWLFDKIRKGY